VPHGAVQAGSYPYGVGVEVAVGTTVGEGVAVEVGLGDGKDVGVTVPDGVAVRVGVGDAVTNLSVGDGEGEGDTV
jgi:hypothetical protein